MSISRCRGYISSAASCPNQVGVLHWPNLLNIPAASAVDRNFLNIYLVSLAFFGCLWAPLASLGPTLAPIWPLWDALWVLSDALGLFLGALGRLGVRWGSFSDFELAMIFLANELQAVSLRTKSNLQELICVFFALPLFKQTGFWDSARDPPSFAPGARMTGV